MLGLNHESDGSAFLIVNIDIYERGHTGYVDTLFSQVSFGNNNGLDSLVHCTSANGLNFGVVSFTHNAGNGASYSRSAGSSRNFDHVQRLRRVTINAMKGLVTCDVVYHGFQFSIA